MRQTPDKLRALAAFLKGKMNMRSLVMTLAVLVVFVTTYLLILPAFTLEKDEAVRQGGIDVVAIETAAENEAAAETETADVEAGSEVKTVAEDEDSTDSNVDADKSEKATASDTKSADVKVLTKEDGLTAEGEGFVVQATTENKTEVPANTELQVAEVSGKADELKEYREAALTALKKDDAEVKDIKEIKVYDMSLEAEGESVKTDSKFNVKIEYEEGVKVEDADNVRVLTFDAENKAAVLDAEENKVETKVESAGKKSNVTEASFETEGISKVAVVEVETLEKTIVADGKTYKVTVKYGKDAGIPDGSTLEVSELKGDAYDAYLEKTASKLDKNADELGNTKFFDITIKNGDEEVKIANPVNVSIQLVGSDNLAESTQVLHFADENKADLVDSKVSGDTVKFSADGFSVYAVVGEGDQGENARMTLHFVVDGTEIGHMFVKNSDTREELNTIIYDPGTGDTNNLIFKGWSLVEDYTVEDADTEWTPGAERGAMDIDDVRDWAAARTIREFEDVYVYAMLYDSYDISFFDEDNAIVHSDLLIFKAGDTNGVSYYINVPYEPKGQDFKFNGWYKDSDSIIEPEMEPYPNQTTVTIKSDTMFSANPDEGHWLVFRENGNGASYTPPQFVLKNQKPTQPTNPTRNGYTFGGWYTDEACTAGNEFDFNQELTERTLVYAKWNVKNPADYTVIIWQQQVTGDQYDFVTSLHLSGTANTNVNSVSQQGTGDNAYARINGTNYQYTGFHLKEFDQNVKIVPEGTGVVNVYYDRNVYTLRFYAETTNSRFYDDNNVDAYRPYNTTLVQTITRRYQQSISDIWNFTGSNGRTYPRRQRINNTNCLTSWLPTNSSTYKARITHMETMPSESIDFYILYTNKTERNFYYYVEALPGATNTRTFNGKQYVLYEHLEHDFNRIYYEDDFWLLDGFERDVIATANGTDVTNYIKNAGANGKSWENNWNSTLYFYYDRVKNKIIYNDGKFVDGNGTKVEDAPAARTAMHQSEDILFGASVANQEGEYNPTLTGYVLEGWYLNKECAGEKFNFSTATMPKGGIQLYAKWVQVQYRVFLHANAKIDGQNDESLDWGGQGMSFRVNYGEQIAGGNTIKGTRDDYEIIGWYFDEALTQPFNFESYVLNDTTVTDTYDKARSTELDDWSDPTESTNKDVTNNRFWINRSLDLYAKWRAKLDGANGINVIYDATNAGYLNKDGTQVQYLEDSLIYKDSSAASAKGAATAKAPASSEDEEMQFLYWEVCKWTGEEEISGSEIDYSKFVGTGEHVYPGNDFTVLKADASMSEVEREDTEDPTKITHAKYTVLLRAVYGPKGAPTPTHITWYANNGTGDTVSDTNLHINEAVDVKDATTFKRDGYKFLGWARKVEVSDEDGNVQTIDGVSPTKLNKTYTEADLFLKWDGEKYIATANTEGVTAGNKVEKIAADEKSPYHGMVAVWQRVYKVSVNKVVVGTSEDKSTDFTFKPIKNSSGTITIGDDFTLKHNGSKEVFDDLLKDDIFSVTETANPDFDISVTGKYTDDDGVEHTIANLGNGTDITIQGDTEITVTNTRKAKKVKIYKVDDSATPVALSEVGFRLGTNQLTTGTDGYTDAVTLDVSTTPYDLTETTPKDHYIGLEATVPITVGATGITVPEGTENVSVSETPDSTGAYTITVVNPRAPYTVTVIKNVDSKVDADKDSQYSFTAAGLSGNTETFELYGRSKEASGTSPAQSNEKKYEDIPYNTTFSITESDEYTDDFDTSITAEHADGTTQTLTELSTGDVTVDGDVTVTFTNTRKDFDVAFVKTDDKGEGLSGATFQLKRKNAENKYVQYLSDDMAIGTTTEKLVSGDYQLVEVGSPDGYIIMSNEIEFSVASDGTVTITKTDNLPNTETPLAVASVNEGKYTITIKNIPGKPLPHTGGIGTTIFYILGSLLVIGCGVVLVSRKRIGSTK